MASFCMQALGCDVSALNTVHFSNHTGYRQFKGTRSSAEEIREIYEGLKQSHLTDFDVMLSGYAPGAEAVNAVGSIARDLKFRRTLKPGSFFWVLDPVMGDQGRLYVNEDVVPAYKALLSDADLILPNQFEAETLSSTSITSLSTLHTALQALHTTHRVPHVVITSVRLPSPTAPSFSADSKPDSSASAPAPGETATQTNPTSPQNLPNSSSITTSTSSSAPTLSVIGSSRTTTGQPRAFQVTVPDLDCFFSGTGDMFAGLLVARLRAAVHNSGPPCANKASWMSPDHVPATELPLAKAVEEVLASMHEVLVRTKEECEREMGAWMGSVEGRRMSGGERERPKLEEAPEGNGDESAKKEVWLRKTKAAEVRVVRNVGLLRGEGVEERFEAVELKI
ncbi:MAG: putative pyridoxal kinase [Stictis urceolatum]|nr:putative pyridoxal kinase [Stictis urceolata]